VCTSFLFIVTAVNSLPLIKPSDEVCQSLSTSCQDLWVASGCKKVKTCINEVWEKLEVPLDNSNVCNICKEMVKEARDQLLSNETQEELKEVLEGSCNLIPLGFISEMCRQFVDSLIPDLIDMLVSRMDPDQVCSIAGLCNPDFMTQGLQTKQHQKLLLSTFHSRIYLPSNEASKSALATKKTPACVKCKDAMKYSKKMFNKISEDRMTSIVLKACEHHLGNQSSECQAIAKVFWPPVSKYLRNMNPDAFCAHLKHCTLLGSTKLEAPLFTRENDDLTCDFCKQLVEHLREMLAANTTQEEIKQAFLNVCEELGPAAEECQKLLEEYFDMVYSYLLEALTPDQFCAAIGLCKQTIKGGMNSQEKAMNKVIMKLFPSTEQKKKHLLKLKLKKYGKEGPSYNSASSIPLVKVIPALPKEYLEANTSVAVPMVKLFPSQKAKAGDIISCSLCKSLIGLVEELLPGNMTVEAISDVLDLICELLPASEEQQCRTFIDTNRDIIIKFLTEDAAPEVVCHLIALCSGKAKLIWGERGVCRSKLQRKWDMKELEMIKQCRKVIPDEEDNIAEVEEADILFSQVIQSTSFTREDYETLDANIATCREESLEELIAEVQDVDPCSSGDDMVSPPAAGVSYYSDCDFCQDVVQFLYSELKNNSTEEELKQLLENVCRLFPGESQNKCLATVDVYFNLVMSMILQEFTPAQICKELGFCPSSKQLPSSVHTVPQPTKHVVKKDKLDNECDICISVVQFVYNELKDNATEEEIKQLLDQACNLFPGKTRQKCVNMVNTYFDILVSLLTQQLSPDQVCQTLGLCPSCKCRFFTPTVIPPLPSGGLGHASYRYRVLLSGRKIRSVKTLLFRQSLGRKLMQYSTFFFCPSYEAECLEGILTTFCFFLNINYFSEVLENDCYCVLSLAAKRVLSSVHTVPKPTKHLAEKSKSGGADCDICINVVQFVYNELKDNSTEEEIRQLLDKVCSLLPGKTRQECVDLVNTYLDALVSLLMQQLTPQQICQTLGLCPSSVVAASALHSSKQGISKAALGGECDICENIVQFVYNEMKEPSSEEEVRKLLDGVCYLFAEAERQKCINLVNNYIDVLIPLLMSEFTPTQICQRLELCPQVKATSLPSTPKTVTLKKVADPDSECAFCHSLVKLVYEELNDDKTEASIRKALDHVCDLCPGDNKQKCITIVNTYYELLVSLLLQEMDPNLICKDFLHICPQGARGNFECTFCQYALHFIQNELVDNVTEARVQEALDKLCDKLPQQFSDECKAFVEEYGPALMVLLAQEIDPSIVCVAIKACPKDGIRRQPEAFVADVKLSKCDTCTTVVDYVERILQSKPNDKEITSLIENVCKAVPKNMQSDCASLVDMYGPYLLDAIGNIGNSREICKFVDMCSDGTEHPKLLGTKQCTQGPSYWCGSPEQAASCNAQEYCKKKIWKQ
ncbi:unnamed protein product, partial [Ixodes hexagonus]